MKKGAFALVLQEQMLHFPKYFQIHITKALLWSKGLSGHSKIDKTNVL